LRAVDIVVAHDVREMSGRHPNLDNPGGNRST
jgi:hypothetical protein